MHCRGYAHTNVPQGETCARARARAISCPPLDRVCTPKLPLCAPSAARRGGLRGRRFREEKASVVSPDSGSSRAEWVRFLLEHLFERDGAICRRASCKPPPPPPRPAVLSTMKRTCHARRALHSRRLDCPR